MPEDDRIRSQILNECHAIPYVTHPRVQRNLARVRQTFYWKCQTGDVTAFVEACLVCETEKTDHTLARGSLQSSHILSQKWQDVSFYFVVGFPDMGDGAHAIMTIISKATSMVHLIRCSKPISAEETAKSYLQYVAKLHDILRNIYSDRDTEFVSKFW